MSFGGRIALAAVSVWTQMWQHHRLLYWATVSTRQRCPSTRRCSQERRMAQTRFVVLGFGGISDLLLSDNHYKATMWNSLYFWERNWPTQRLLLASICVYRVYGVKINMYETVRSTFKNMGLLKWTFENPQNYNTPWIQTPLSWGTISLTFQAYHWQPCFSRTMANTSASEKQLTGKSHL